MIEVREEIEVWKTAIRFFLLFVIALILVYSASAVIDFNQYSQGTYLLNSTYVSGNNLTPVYGSTQMTISNVIQNLTDSPTGYAWGFNGASSYLNSYTNIAPFRNATTWSFCVKYSANKSSGSTQNVLSMQSVYSVIVHDTAKQFMWLMSDGAGWDKNYYVNNLVNDNEWRTDCMTKNLSTGAGGFSLYANGTKTAYSVGSDTASGIDTAFIMPLTGNWTIGVYDPTLAGAFYNGKIAEFCFFNATLNQTEITWITQNSCYYQFVAPPTPTLTIKTDMANASNVNDPNLVVHYNGTMSYTTTDLYNCSFQDNGTVLNTSMDVNMSVNNIFNYSWGEIEKDFLFAINCSNFEASYKTSYYRYRVDTIPPKLVINTTLFNNSVYYKGQVVQMTSEFSDTNLFAYNITIKKAGTVEKNVFAMNITTAIASNYTEYAADVMGNYTVLLEAWDSHTSNAVSSLILNQGKQLSYADVLIKGNYSYTIAKETDKYSFTLNYDQSSSVQKLELSGDNLIYLPNSKYKGHFVDWKNKRWIDFESDAIVSVVQEKGKFIITLDYGKPVISSKFNSIGDLNYNSAGYLFSVSDPSYELLVSFNDFKDQTLEVINLLPLIFIYITFLALGFWMVRSNNFIPGICLLGLTILMDFVLMAKFDELYVQPMILQGGWYAYSAGILGMGLLVWIAVKGIAVFMIKGSIQKFKY